MEGKENRTIVKHFRVSEHEDELLMKDVADRGEDYDLSKLVREKLGFDK